MELAIGVPEGCRGEVHIDEQVQILEGQVSPPPPHGIVNIVAATPCVKHPLQRPGAAATDTLLPLPLETVCTRTGAACSASPSGQNTKRLTNWNTLYVSLLLR